MATARFFFHEPLSAFLKRELRGRAFSYECARAASLKNAIEALGVPHTEAGAVTVNGALATLQRTVREGDIIEIRAVEMEAGSDPDYFLADAHLGGLARFLRMLGFDTLHDQAIHDDEIRRIAEKERRVVLTRDRELLKCRDIVRGCYVRALKPEAQLREVAARYGLARRARPFSLCLRCNLPLEPVDKAAVAAQVPQKVLSLNEAFSHCRGCGRIYWPGSHYQRMRAALGAALPSD
ncbi:MAG TPA: Mut7-C RNAse domain-containing protein [Burkholderiales bacterium]